MVGTLTDLDKVRLTRFKWRYSLETAGFTPEEARRLLFFKWLALSGRMGG